MSKNNPKILAFAGSARDGSYNKMLVRIAARGATDTDAEVTVIDLRDYPMPLYDADIESSEGLPKKASSFKNLLSSHQGLLIASPENNSSVTALLKNTIDWASRSPEGEGDLSGFEGKVVSLMSASPGGLGGLRGLVHLKSILGNIGCIVLPDQVTVRSAYNAFDDSGNLKDSDKSGQVEELGANLANFLKKLG